MMQFEGQHNNRKTFVIYDKISKQVMQNTGICQCDQVNWSNNGSVCFFLAY